MNSSMAASESMLLLMFVDNCDFGAALLFGTYGGLILTLFSFLAPPPTVVASCASQRLLFRPDTACALSLKFTSLIVVFVLDAGIISLPSFTLMRSAGRCSCNVVVVGVDVGVGVASCFGSRIGGATNTGLLICSVVECGARDIMNPLGVALVLDGPLLLLFNPSENDILPTPLVVLPFAFACEAVLVLP